ncbi:PREDICTED: uncharacterized protein LOC108776483 isoform X1 [Cyphomyrmex costatus]|uniref:uncharacterized protein LOC108776483 isoform X1 n=1 Tax=Cyphomyrmex costatus TaxID=456900 RepID=UPI00085230D4|nr:PREDICTED: uncharacterized protein LOC108776483 isoform X1 [Cyphomyrmex costatus]
MQSYIVIALLITFVMAFENAAACNCEHCDEERVIGLGVETTTTQAMYKEDSDNDGNLTICARNRDFNERTFPSICYMLCYNRCTKYRMVAVKENDIKKYVLIASRPNYYKLRDGAC